MGTDNSASVEISEPLLHQSTTPPPNLESLPIPHWKDQITIRGLLVSAFLGALFCIITHKLSLTAGVIPSLNVAAGLLGFFFLKTYTSLFSKLGFSLKPFTPQENTVIQTCVVACYGLAFSGTHLSFDLFIFTTYLLLFLAFLFNATIFLLKKKIGIFCLLLSLFEINQ